MLDLSGLYQHTLPEQLRLVTTALNEGEQALKEATVKLADLHKQLKVIERILDNQYVRADNMKKNMDVVRLDSYKSLKLAIGLNNNNLLEIRKKLFDYESRLKKLKDNIDTLALTKARIERNLKTIVVTGPWTTSE